MAKQRILVDLVLIAVVVLVAAGAWWWKDRQMDQLREEHQFHVEQLHARAQEWAETLARGEVEAVGRSFASGITPMVLSQRTESIDQAVVALLDVSGVVFVHVLDPEGNVLASSDRKLVTTGTGGGKAAWALGSPGLRTRRSERSGVLELAAPIVGGAGISGVLWMGYDVRQRVESAKPASLMEGSPEMGGAQNPVPGAGSGEETPAQEGSGEETGEERRDGGDGARGEGEEGEEEEGTEVI